MGIETSVIGIGNLLFTDEGIGVHAVNALGERFTSPQGLTLLDGGTKGLELLPFVEECDRLMLIDAVDFDEEPGYIRIIERSDVRKFLDLKFSVHQIGVPDMLFAAEFMGILPQEMCLVGIQPASLEMGTGLSPLLQERMEPFLTAIIERLKVWGISPQPLSSETRNAPMEGFYRVSGHTV